MAESGESCWLMVRACKAGGEGAEVYGSHGQALGLDHGTALHTVAGLHPASAGVLEKKVSWGPYTPLCGASSTCSAPRDISPGHRCGHRMGCAVSPCLERVKLGEKGAWPWAPLAVTPAAGARAGQLSQH